jgi:hypothetical protein
MLISHVTAVGTDFAHSCCETAVALDYFYSKCLDPHGLLAGAHEVC